MREVGISPSTKPSSSLGFVWAPPRLSLDSDLAAAFESYTQGAQAPCSGSQIKNGPRMRVRFLFVRRVGFEPT